jgi:exodeoxyribonuclease-1
MRVAASLRPDVLKTGTGQQGRPSFKLADLAVANGIEVQRAHEASADVELTRALCNHIKIHADELWSRLIRFGKKSTAAEFITCEAAFAFCEIRGNLTQIRLATRFGQHSTQGNVHYALDLTCDPLSLARLSDEELTERFSERPSPLVTIKTNASPSMCPLHECTADMLGEIPENEAERRANLLINDVDLMSRLESVARSLEKKWPESAHVEEQLYGGQKITDADLALQNEFHLAPWADKPKIAGSFSELRFKRLAQRILYFNSPEHLSEKARSAVSAEIERRLREPITAEVPWLTIARAHAELDKLLPECDDELERRSLLAYREYLQERFGVPT